LGAGRIGVFLTVTLPLALPGIITGVLLSFARSLASSCDHQLSSPTFRRDAHAAARDLYLYADAYVSEAHCVGRDRERSVRVSPGMLETKVMVAPNSPKLRARTTARP